MSSQNDESGDDMPDAREENDRLSSRTRNKFVVYKEEHTGFKTKRYEKESGRWVERKTPKKSMTRQAKTQVSQGLVVGIGTAADKVFLHHGIGVSANAGVNAAKAECETSVANVSGLNVLDAGAEAKVGNAGAGASATPVEAQAFAKASGAEAGAHAGIVEGVLEAKARAVAGEAQARAGVGLVDLGARAGKTFYIN